MADIAKVTTILEALAMASSPLSLGALGLKTGIPRSTVYRVIRSLESESLVLRDPVAPGYVLGPRVLKFGLAGVNRVTGDVGQIISRISRETGAYVGLVVFSGREAVVAADASPDGGAPEVPRVLGRSGPMHACAGGRALLAQLDDGRVAELIGDASDRERLEQSVRDIRSSGVSFSFGEDRAGICGVATPLVGDRGVLQAVSVAFPERRLQQVSRVLASLGRSNPRISTGEAMEQLRQQRHVRREVVLKTSR